MNGGSPILSDLTVVIPTLGRSILAQSLEAIAGGSARPAQVVVVDQGRVPEVEAMVRGLGASGIQGEYVPSHERGRARGVNRGIERVRTRFLVITDDDCEAEPGWIQAMWEELTAHPEAIVTGRVEAGGDEPVAVVVTSPVPTVQVRPRLTFDTLSGGNMGMARALVDRIGPLDEDPAVATAEDAEYAYRALRAGVPLRYAPSAGVAHIGWRDEGERDVQYRSYARSHGGFYGKYLRRGDLFILLRMFVHMARAGKRWIRGLVRRDRDLVRNGWAYLTGLPVGVWSGLRNRRVEKQKGTDA
jgi:GT2 family glycosyltransferase